MTFFEIMSLIGKVRIVQTLDTFSYALSRCWTILEIPHLVSTDVTSDLMNHMSKLDLCTFGAQNSVKHRVFRLFECSPAQIGAKACNRHSCVPEIVHRERPGALTAERQASGARRLGRVPLEAQVLRDNLHGFNPI